MISATLFLLSYIMCILSEQYHLNPKTKALQMSNPPQFTMRECNICSRWQPDRMHHCKYCQVCCFYNSHHCFIIDRCIGYHNMRFYCQMILHMLILSIYGIINFFYNLELYTEQILQIYYQEVSLVKIFKFALKNYYLPAGIDLEWAVAYLFFIQSVLALTNFELLKNVLDKIRQIPRRLYQNDEVKEAVYQREMRDRGISRVRYLPYPNTTYKNITKLFDNPFYWLLPIPARVDISYIEQLYSSKDDAIKSDEQQLFTQEHVNKYREFYIQ
ncbi:hypothetical protein pb186bvf_016538 [Paramecium bursaria]